VFLFAHYAVPDCVPLVRLRNGRTTVIGRNLGTLLRLSEMFRQCRPNSASFPLALLEIAISSRATNCSAGTHRLFSLIWE
jgi:hypothetical protein